MTSRSSSALRKSTAQRKSNVKARTGKLPEWNLDDLYSGIDAPEVTRDLQKMDAECVAFETDYKGRLAERTAAEGGGQWLAEAVKRYEAIDDLAGRLLDRALGLLSRARDTILVHVVVTPFVDDR